MSKAVRGNLTLVLAIAAIDGEVARGDVPPSDNRLALLYTGHILQVVSPTALNEWWGESRKSRSLVFDFFRGVLAQYAILREHRPGKNNNGRAVSTDEGRYKDSTR